MIPSSCCLHPISTKQPLKSTQWRQHASRRKMLYHLPLRRITGTECRRCKPLTMCTIAHIVSKAVHQVYIMCYRGEDDVALFDFTSLFASENAARIVERKGRRVLLCVAGDSLNEVCNTYCIYNNYTIISQFMYVLITTMHVYTIHLYMLYMLANA